MCVREREGGGESRPISFHSVRVRSRTVNTASNGGVKHALMMVALVGDRSLLSDATKRHLPSVYININSTSMAGIHQTGTQQDQIERVHYERCGGEHRIRDKHC